MTKHAGTNTSRTQPAEPRVMSFLSAPTPPHLSPSLCRLFHRQHEHRHRDHHRNGRLRRPGVPHHAPLHQESGFRKTPPIRQRYKQILQLSWSDTRAWTWWVKTSRPAVAARVPGHVAAPILFVSPCKRLGILEFLIYLIITNFGDTFHVVLLK